MLPLLQDAIVIAMAVTIMFGLGFATVLTLIVVPVLCSLAHSIKNRGAKAQENDLLSDGQLQAKDYPV